MRAARERAKAYESLPMHTAMTPLPRGFALPAPLPLNAHRAHAHYGSDRLSRLRPAPTASAGCTAQSGSLQLPRLWPALPPRLNGFVSALIPLVSRLSIACLSLDLAYFLLIPSVFLPHEITRSRLTHFDPARSRPRSRVTPNSRTRHPPPRGGGGRGRGGPPSFNRAGVRGAWGPRLRSITAVCMLMFLLRTCHA